MARAIDLSGRVALITGATRGIGLASAIAMYDSGADVVLVGRDEQALEATSRHLKSRGPRTPLSLVADIADPASVQDLFQNVFRQYRRLDILVANAGIMEDAVLGLITPNLLQRVYAVNSFGFLYCCQYASRLMIRHGGGSIIGIGSIVGERGFPGQSVYAGSKAALVGSARALAKELATHQVRVNVVAPGYIETDMTARLSGSLREAATQSIAMGRAGQPAEVADVVLFLASDLSRYVTGQVIGVDGGMKV